MLGRDLAPLGPRTGQQLFNTPAWAGSLRFSPDDRFLAAEVAETKLRIWEVARPGAYRTLVGDPAPDGHHVYRLCDQPERTLAGR